MRFCTNREEEQVRNEGLTVFTAQRPGAVEGRANGEGRSYGGPREDSGAEEEGRRRVRSRGDKGAKGEKLSQKYLGKVAFEHGRERLKVGGDGEE